MCMILRSLVLTHYQRVTDGQTDTPPIAKSCYSIVERKKKRKKRNLRLCFYTVRPTYNVENKMQIF